MVFSDKDRQQKRRLKLKVEFKKSILVRGVEGEFDERIRTALAVKELAENGLLPQDVLDKIAKASETAFPTKEVVVRKYINKIVSKYLTNKECKEKTMAYTDVFDKDLNPTLAVADNDDLAPIVEYLDKKFSNLLTEEDGYKKHYPDHSKYSDLIGKELRDMGGNSFVNIFRGEGPTYHEIVCDVAKKLKAPYNKNKAIEDIEDSILETILSKALESMSSEEKEKLLKEMGGKGKMGKGGIATSTFIGIFRSGGFYSYQLTLIVANQIARAVLGRGLALSANAGIARGASILAGPVGWVIGGLWTAADLSGPAYSVTIPCVVHVAMLRKKLNSLQCSKCDAVLPDTTMKFCPECGQATAA